MWNLQQCGNVLVLRQSHRLPDLLIGQLKFSAAKQGLKNLDRGSATKVDRRPGPIKQYRIVSLSHFFHRRD